MKLYTKKGDKGQTSLLGGRRVSKSIVRLEVIGCLDELNAQLGLIVAKLDKLGLRYGENSTAVRDGNASEYNASKDSDASKDGPKSTLLKQITRIQSELFDMGADVATTFSTSTSLQKSITRIPENYISQLEEEIDQTEKALKPLKNFILPGGHEIAAEMQIARAIARRAERNMVRLQKGAKVNQNALKYLNRLSDWLFAKGRLVNKWLNVNEKVWE
ncbi:cob(I)yrinic acid a,c-diamide adenosyltransferase [Candidatus Dojkabacteria bacterium]|nr:cob(I)yrinic acid a,c-diamide adenosyltransferase [Candidatus Dojkabacteria bacterium]